MSLSFDSYSLNSEEQGNLIFIKQIKGGELWRNKFDTALYFKRPDSSLAHYYKKELLDFLEEWGSLDLSLKGERKKLLASINILSENIYPAYCSFEDGFDSDYCQIQLTNMPPGSSYFENNQKKKRWYYLSQVKEMKSSSKAVSNEIIARMLKMQKKSNSQIKQIKKIKGNLLDHPELHFPNTNTVVRHKDGRLFKWSDPETFVFYNYVDAFDLQLIDSPTQMEIEKAIQLSPDLSYFDRGNYKQPIDVVTVFGDL